MTDCATCPECGERHPDKFVCECLQQKIGALEKLLEGTRFANELGVDQDGCVVASRDLSLRCGWDDDGDLEGSSELRARLELLRFVDAMQTRLGLDVELLATGAGDETWTVEFFER